MSIMRGALSSETLRREPPSKWPAFPAAPTSSTPASPCAISQQRKAVRPKNMPPSPTASPCVFAGDTLYCSAKDGFIPGPHGGVYATTTPHQLRQTMRNQLDNLEEADMKFDQVVSTNVYLDDLSDLAAFDEVYAQYFGSVPPARTVVQQIAPTERKADKDDHFPGLEQVSLIAVRKR